MTAHELLIRHREVSRLARLLTELLAAMPGQAAPEREAGARLWKIVIRLASAAPDRAVLCAVREQLDEQASRACVVMQEHCRTLQQKCRRQQQQQQQEHRSKVDAVCRSVQQCIQEAVQQVEERLKQELQWNRRQLEGSLDMFLDKSLCCHKMRQTETDCRWQQDTDLWLRETCRACCLRTESRSRALFAALHSHIRAVLSHHPDIFAPAACQSLAALLPQGIGSNRPLSASCKTQQITELRQACEVALAGFAEAEEKRLSAVLQNLTPAVQDFCRKQMQESVSHAPSAEQLSAENQLRAGEALLHRLCAARDDLRDLKDEF